MVRDRLVFPYQTLNSSFKISINVSSILKSYPSELLTHTFFKLVSKFKQQHSQELFWILWISNSFQDSTKLVQFHIFAGCSDLPGSRFWPDTCGMLRQQKVRDRKFHETRGNICIISVHTDKYFDLEGTILCPRKVAVPGKPAVSGGGQTVIVPPLCCNSRTLWLQIPALHFLLVQKQTPTPKT